MDLYWYWNRLKAMGPAEMLSHGIKKSRQIKDSCFLPDWTRWQCPSTELADCYPLLPEPNQAPEVLKQGLEKDVRAIVSGRWKFFGHLDLQVDDPPHWYKDYISGKDFQTTRSAFRLNHRKLDSGSDIKLIWELSRWYSLVRLAQAAFVFRNEDYAETCLRLLENWTKYNPPYRGFNWTSSLEVGMRLIQFTWIDGLLSKSFPSRIPELNRIAKTILPQHAYFAGRYLSFGSSANNHILGELAGLITATCRWPSLEEYGIPLVRLRELWQKEVLKQFAPDGGNREQALNYHIYSWEFCRQSATALHCRKMEISEEVLDRLAAASTFYATIQAEPSHWDYGDSDDAYVTPFVLDENRSSTEYVQWFRDPESSPGLNYWWNKDLWKNRSISSPRSQPKEDWQMFQDSGLAVFKSSDWTLRFDFSKLGYLATAAHGHLDALHLSLWYRGNPVLIDPGTGAYYGDTRLRVWLASRSVHNGPNPLGGDFPNRLGPFLWASHHEVPQVDISGNILGRFSLPSGEMQRRIKFLTDGNGWQIEDTFYPDPSAGSSDFEVRWQFPPESSIESRSERKFKLTLSDSSSLVIEVSKEWQNVDLNVPTEIEKELSPQYQLPVEGPLDGICSRRFRCIEYAPFILLRGKGHSTCVFLTRFLASAPK